MVNPFPIVQYIGPSYFCDRNQELSILIEAFQNQRPCLLHAIRKIGKTGLIHHFHHHLKKKKIITVYFDIMDTRSDKDFVNKMVQACISAIESRKSRFIDRLTRYFGRLRPILTFDPFTGMPEIELNINSDNEVRTSLAALADMLGQMDQPIQIAIDEFQQIVNYENTVIDASLRSYFHKMPHVHFLYSGSQRHLLLALFVDSKKPMFASAQQVNLSHIEEKIYHSFIKKKFAKSKIKITDEAIQEILRWTRIHTFYTQFFCNRLYAQGHTKIGDKEVAYIKHVIFREYETAFMSYQRLLSSNQLKLIEGIAKEGSLTSINAPFLSKYKMAESSARQALKTLLDREMIYEEWEEDKNRYFVYDQFFGRWLAR